MWADNADRCFALSLPQADTVPIGPPDCSVYRATRLFKQILFKKHKIIIIHKNTCKDAVINCLQYRFSTLLVNWVCGSQKKKNNILLNSSKYNSGGTLINNHDS